jgi:hypothetical protein
MTDRNPEFGSYCGVAATQRGTDGVASYAPLDMRANSEILGILKILVRLNAETLTPQNRNTELFLTARPASMLQQVLHFALQAVILT